MAIRIGILGYGNLGRGVECAVRQNEDMELFAVFTRRDPAAVKLITEGVPVYSASDLPKHKEDIDVLVICGGSATDLPKMTNQEQSAFARFLASLAAFFTSSQSHKLQNTQTTTTPMKKIFTSICAILACEHLLSEDGKVTLEDGQLEQVETAITTDKQTISQLQAQVQTLTAEKQALTTEKQQLEADKQSLSASVLQLTTEITALKQKPGDTTAHVVNSQAQQQHQEKSEAEQYFETRNNAKALFDMIP